jgi:ArsR family transcriptional regulator
MTLSRLKDVFSALANERRLAILLYLKERGEANVSDVVEALNLFQANASQGLKVLELAGLVSKRREGNRSYYSLTPLAEVILNSVVLQKAEKGAA